MLVTEQNYELMEGKGIEAYVKYNYFDKEQHGTRSSFNADQLYYNEAEDYIVCPMGQHMQNIGTHKEKNKSGYTQTITKYQAPNCNGCPLRGMCHKQKGNRIIEVNHKLRRLKAQAADLFCEVTKAAENEKSDAGMWNPSLPTGSKTKASVASACAVKTKWASK